MADTTDPRLYLPPTTLEPVDDVMGVQTPTIFRAPPWHEWGEDAEFYAEMGLQWLKLFVPRLELLPWQKLVLRNLLARNPERRTWAAQTACLMVPRQNGKNVILVAYILLHLYFIPARDKKPKKIVYTTHEYDGAVSFKDMVVSFIEDSPRLMARTLSWTNGGNGKQVIRLQDKAQCVFIVRSNEDKLRGQTPHILLFDEALKLAGEADLNMRATISSVSDSQVIYTTSAGKSDSDVLRDLQSRGHLTPEDEDYNPGESFLYLEWTAAPAVEDGVEWTSQEAVKISNPSLGYFQYWDKIQSDELSSATRTQAMQERYKRERLGIWAAENSNLLIPDQMWKLASAPDELPHSNRIIKTSIAVEIDQDNRSYIASAAQFEDGEVVVELTEAGDGRSWVLDAIQDIRKSHRLTSPIVLDSRGGASSALQTVFQKARVPVRLTTAAELCTATAEFYARLSGDSDTRLYYNPRSEFVHELTDSALMVGQRFIGQTSTWTWAGTSAVPDEPMRAVTLAFAGLAVPPKKPGRPKTTSRQRNYFIKR